MNANLVTEIINEAIAQVDILLVVLLLGVGFIIKHVKLLEKVPNDAIPVILILISLAYELSSSFSMVSVISAIVSSAVAIGLHQEGKFGTSVIPKILELLKSKEAE